MAGLDKVVRDGMERFRQLRNQQRRYESLPEAVKRAVDNKSMYNAQKDESFSNPYLPGAEKYRGLIPNEAVRGFVYTPEVDPAQNTIYQREGLARRLDPNDAKTNEDHEVSHLLAARNTGTTGHPLMYNRRLGIKDEDFMGFWKGLVDTLETNKEALRGSYRALQDSDYLDRPKQAPFGEIMALMNQIEDTYGVDLTKDRRFAEFFSNPTYREMYNSASGYRRTRMDARDLPPYTPRKK